MFLKQSTSAVVLVGPVLDASGVAVTTAVIGDFTLTKNGTSAVMAGNTISHSHNGHYAITLTSGNTDTIGRLAISVNNTSQAMPVFRWDICQPTVYDALFANAVNTTGGLAVATAAISALAGTVSTYAGGDTAGTTTLLTRLPSTITLTAGRVTANTDQWGGVSVTGMPMPTYTQPTGFLAATFPGTVSSFAGGAVASVTGAVGSVTAGVTVTTNNDKTGYSLTVTPPTAAANAAAVWDEAMSTHTINGSYGSHVVRSANQNQNTVSITGSQHVAADVHQFQAAVITEVAFADNALSNRVLAANAAAEVATAVRTELAIELGRIDVSSSSRLASSAYTAPDNAGITLIKAVTDRLNTGLVQDGAVWQFTVNMLENGPAGGGGGSATVGNQLLILDQLDLIQNKTDLISGASGITSLLAGAILDPGQITSFPETLTIGDSYTEANGRAIQIPVVDTNGVPISSTGSLYFSSATVTFVIKRAGELDSDRIISGTATFVDPPGTGTGDEAPYVVVELSSSETLKGLVKYKYTGILTFTWPGTSDEVMSFETNTITFRE